MVRNKCCLILLVVLLLMLFVGAGTFVANNYSARQVIFKSEKFEDGGMVVFTLRSPYKSVRRWVVLNQLEKQVIERQGGKILKIEGTSHNLEGTLRQPQVYLTRRLLVQVNHKHMQQSLWLRQHIYLADDKMVVKTTLDQPEQNARLNELNSELTIVPDQDATMVMFRTFMVYRDSVPDSHHEKVRIEVRQSVLSMLSTLKSCFTDCFPTDEGDA